MSDLVLVRHAATEWSGLRLCGRTDPSLSSAGRAQLAPLCERVRGMALRDRTVLSSPARRALETARAIAEAIGADVRVDDRLQEADLGRADGMTFAELETAFPEIARAMAMGDPVDWPDGETAGSLADRIDALARELEMGGVDRIVVTHGGPMRAFLTRSGLSSARLIAPAELVVLRSTGSGGSTEMSLADPAR